MVAPLVLPRRGRARIHLVRIRPRSGAVSVGVDIRIGGRSGPGQIGARHLFVVVRSVMHYDRQPTSEISFGRRPVALSGTDAHQDTVFPGTAKLGPILVLRYVIAVSPRLGILIASHNTGACESLRRPYSALLGSLLGSRVYTW